MANKDKTAWDFVATHYPKYHGADEIAHADSLHKLLNDEQEEGDDAHELLHEKYNGDVKNPQIQHDYNALHVQIYERSIECYLEIN